jgi:hypothetical protein
MSHLVCPLCGKNAPLSTLHPENLPLDLELVRFKGLGRGRGFAVGEVTSIMGDEEITPIVAARLEKLYYFFVEKGELMVPLIVSSDGLYVGQIEGFKKQLREKNLRISSLDNDLKEIKESHELDGQVDYIIRESLDFIKARSQFGADEGGWYLNLSPDYPELSCYLFLLMMKIPSQLKERLLKHVKRDGNPLFYDYMLKRFPRKQSIAERITDINNTSAVEAVDEFGKQCVRILSPRYYPEFTGRTMGHEELVRLVKIVKEHVRDPELNVMKEIFDVLYPLRRKLPINSDT